MALLSASHSPGICSAGLNTSPQELTPSEQAEGSEGPPLALLGSPQYLRLPASSRQPVPASWRGGVGMLPLCRAHFQTLGWPQCQEHAYPTGASLRQRWWVRSCDYPGLALSLGPQSRQCSSSYCASRTRLWPPPSLPSTTRPTLSPLWASPNSLSSNLRLKFSSWGTLKMRLGTRSPLQHGAVF